MSSLKNYFWNIVLIISITVVAMYFSLKDHFTLIVDSILQMNGIYLFICLMGGVIITLVWALCYLIIARRYEKNYSYKKAITVAFVGTFFNGITPSATGGQFAQAYVLRKQGISLSDGASVLWADFIIYQTTMMIYVTALFILRFQHFADLSAWFWIVFAGYLVNVAVIIGLYLIALFPAFMIRSSSWIAEILEKVHLIKDSQAKKASWKLQIRNFNKQIKILSRDKEMIIKVALVNVVRLTLYFALPWFIAKGLSIKLPKGSLMDTITLASFVIMANSFIPLPGSSGGTEVVFQALFYHMFGNLTAAVMLIWRISSYYLTVILGAVVFIIFKSRQDEEKRKRKEEGKA